MQYIKHQLNKEIFSRFKVNDKIEIYTDREKPSQSLGIVKGFSLPNSTQDLLVRVYDIYQDTEYLVNPRFLEVIL